MNRNKNNDRGKEGVQRGDETGQRLFLLGSQCMGTQAERPWQPLKPPGLQILNGPLLYVATGTFW